MIHLRLYENFQTGQEKEISYICKQHDIRNWSINSEGLLDVDGNVTIYNKGLSKLPLKFGSVTGNFDCVINKLSSLEGSPKYVGGNFDCSNKELKSLEGGPKEVGGHFDCSNNKLKSLEGGPKHVGGNFYCYNNKLSSFEGVPESINGYFYCLNNLIYNIWKIFEDYSKIELFNYYDIIRELDGKPAIVLARLNQFLEDIGKPPVKKVEGYINI